MARILLIDDEHNIRMMVKMALQSVGHRLSGVPDGQEGLELFRTGEEWDLVLLDQRMPGMDGLEVLREIRKRRPEARVIMITAFGTIDLAVEAMRVGARDFLRKPFTAETLRGAVDAVLRTEAAQPTPDSGPITYGMATVNGFHIDWQDDGGRPESGAIEHRFTITDPRGVVEGCTVTLSDYLVEQVRCHVGSSPLLRTERFWHALCEEVVANYVWQHGDFPPNGELRLDETTTGLLRWTDAVTAPVASAS